MDMKDKIVLVYYIGVKKIEKQYLNDFLTQVRNSIAHDRDDSVDEFFIPTFETDETRIECINPVLLSEEKYAEVEKTLAEMREKMEKVIENYSKK
jgi:hypothetical protein